MSELSLIIDMLSKSLGFFFLSAHLIHSCKLRDYRAVGIYDEFLDQIGYTEDDLKSIAKEYLASDLVSLYVLEKEGINEESDEFNEKMTELLELSGFTTKEDAIAAGVTEENILRATRSYLASDIVIKHANVTEVNADDSDVVDLDM